MHSKFLRILKINSIEFSEFGNSFSFKWNRIGINSNQLKNNEDKNSYKLDSDNLTDSQNTFINTYGIVLANTTTYIGKILFNSRHLCQPKCYLGLEPKVKTSSSIIDISSIKIKNLNSLENLDESFIYELWIKSLNEESNRVSHKRSNAFDLDLKLLKLLHRRWTNLNKRKSLFKSSLKIQIYLDPSKSALINDDVRFKSVNGEDDKKRSNFFV